MPKVPGHLTISLQFVCLSIPEMSGHLAVCMYLLLHASPYEVVVFHIPGWYSIPSLILQQKAAYRFIMSSLGKYLELCLGIQILCNIWIVDWLSATKLSKQ